MAEVARDGLVGDLAGHHVDAARERAVARAPRRRSRGRRSRSTYGSVAFVSARVELIGTAPGMFATQ